MRSRRRCFFWSSFGSRDNAALIQASSNSDQSPMTSVLLCYKKKVGLFDQKKNEEKDFLNVKMRWKEKEQLRHQETMGMQSDNALPLATDLWAVMEFTWRLKPEFLDVSFHSLASKSTSGLWLLLLMLLTVAVTLWYHHCPNYTEKDSLLSIWTRILLCRSKFESCQEGQRRH